MLQALQGVSGMRWQRKEICSYLEMCLSGEAVQVAYGNKDYTTGLCVFGRVLASLGPKAQHDTPILSKAKQWGNRVRNSNKHAVYIV